MKKGKGKRKSTVEEDEDLRRDLLALAQYRQLNYPATRRHYKDLGIAVLAMAVKDLHRFPPKTQEGDSRQTRTRRLNEWKAATEYRRTARQLLRGGPQLKLWCLLADFDSEIIARHYNKEVR